MSTPHIVSEQVLPDFPARARVSVLIPQRALRCLSVRKIRGASVGSVLGASAANRIWEISCLSPRGRVFQEEGTASADSQRRRQKAQHRQEIKGQLGRRAGVR